MHSLVIGINQKLFSYVRTFSISFIETFAGVNNWVWYAYMI